MKTKRLIALLCVLAMTICLFAGCGNSTTPTPESTPTPEASTPTPDATTPTPDATPTPTPAPTPTLPPVEDLIIGYEISNIDEANKTATLCGIKLAGWPEIASEEVRKAITELKIPGEVDGYTIIELSWDVMGQSKYQGSIGFCGGEGLPDCYVKKLTIPASVKKIQYFAFGFCGAIEEVIFEGDPNEIDFSDNVFGTIPYVNNAVLANNGYFVVGGNLQYGVDWGDIVIPDGVRIVGDRIWEYQRYTDSDAGTYLGITTITLPEGVEHIGKDLVRDDMEVEWIYIPASVTSINDSAICNPATVVKTVKGSYAEKWAKEKGLTVEAEGGVEDLIIGYEIRDIDEENKTATICGVKLKGWPEVSSEETRQAITELRIPSEVDGYKIVKVSWDFMGQSKWDGTLGFCSEEGLPDCWVKTVIVPDTIEEFEYGVFVFCGAIEDVIFEGDPSNIKFSDNVFGTIPYVNKAVLANNGYFVVGGNLQYAVDWGDIIIPDGVKEIGDRIWQYQNGTPDEGTYKEITSITLPDGVEIIGKELVRDDMNINYIYIPRSVTKIHDSAIENPSTIIRVDVGSYAAKWAMEKGFTVEYVDENGNVYSGELEKFKNTGWELIDIDEENKTATLWGPVLPGWPEASSEDYRKTVDALYIPSYVGGYKITKLAYCVMGQSRWGGSVGFCHEEGMPDFWGKTLVIPKTVKEIEYEAFAYTESISNVVFEGNPANITFQNNVFGNGEWVRAMLDGNLPGSTWGYLIVGGTLLQTSDYNNLVIPESATKINGRIFLRTGNAEDTKTITIHDNVTYIANNAFDGAESAVIKCHRYTYAETWAKEHGFAIEYLDYGNGEELIQGWEYEVLSEEDKTICLTGAKLEGWDVGECAPESIREQITELHFPAYVDGYKVVRLSWTVMGQSKWGGTISFCGDDGMPGTWIRKVYIPWTVEYLEYSSICYGMPLQEVVFANEKNIKHMESNVFGDTDYSRNTADANGGFLVINGMLQACNDYNNVVIPKGVKEICDRVWAFIGNIDDVNTITIPKAVKKIGSEFANERIIIKCYAGSYAEQWATENGYQIEIIK